MQALAMKYCNVEFENRQLKRQLSREKAGHAEAVKDARWLQRALTAVCILFTIIYIKQSWTFNHLADLQQETGWELRTQLKTCRMDYMRVTGSAEDPAWVEPFPPLRYSRLHVKQQIIYDQQNQAEWCTVTQVADLPAAGWDKACVLAGHAWDAVCTKGRQLSTLVSSA